MNPDLDLTLQRVIRAPRAVVWRAWTDPSQLEQWWVPAPAVARVDRLEVRPGGALRDAHERRRRRVRARTWTRRSWSSTTVERLVFTNAVDSRWRPDAARTRSRWSPRSSSRDHPDGTDYRVVVRHGDPAARARHEELGFFDGWGSVTEQLAALVEGAAVR